MDFQEKTARFMQWFRAQEGATFDSRIQLVDWRDRDAGRAIVATDEIPAGTVIFSIPRPAILNVETSGLARLTGELLRIDQGDDAPALHDTATTTVTTTTPGDSPAAAAAAAATANAAAPVEDEEIDDSSSSDSWIALILVMIYEYLRGDASPWKAYLDILPTDFHTPMFWEAAEVAELQASTTVHRIGKTEAETMFRKRIIPALHQYAHVFYSPGQAHLTDEEIVTLAHRVGSIIMSYAFDLENDDDDDEEEEDGWIVDRDGKQMLGMVPMADMMNADAEFNAFVNHDTDALIVTTIRPVHAGEEILNFYGPHPNSELLRRYGYVTDRHSRYDVVEIPASLIRQNIQSTLKLTDAFWEKSDRFVDEDELVDPIVIERDPPEVGPNGLFIEAAAKTYGFRQPPAELQEQITMRLKALRKVSSSVVPDKRRREEICTSVMRAVLLARLAEYPTSLEEDERLLTQPSTQAPEARRLRMAIRVRAGEKALLQESLEVLGNGEPQEESGRPEKRARV